MKQPPARIAVLTGHYGRSKSEIAIHLALRLIREYRSVAPADPDVVNPCFRSRERRALLESKGVRVIGNSIGIDQGVYTPPVSAEVFRYAAITAHVCNNPPWDINGEIIPIEMHLREAWMASTQEELR